MRDSSDNARLALMLLWILFFVANLSVILYLYLAREIEADNMRFAFKAISDLYAPYVGAITMFYWGARGSAHSPAAKPASAPFFLALLVSGLWNLLVFVLMFRLLLGSGTIEDSVEQIAAIGGSLSWLVAGGVGYYFANTAGSGSLETAREQTTGGSP